MGRQGDSLNTVLTYSPYVGAVLEGDQSAFHFGNPGAEVHIGRNFKASLKMSVSKEKYATYEADASIKPDANTGYIRTASANIHKPIYTLQYNADLNKALYLEKATKHAETEFYASLGADGPATGFAALAKLQQYQASVPPGTQGSAAGKVGPLTQIPFIQDVLR